MNSKILKFNKKLYSCESIQQATNEYRKIFKGEILPNFKKKGPYFEIELQGKDCPENFADEFCNYVLYLSFK